MFWENLWHGIQKAIQALSPVYAGAGGAAIADGPLPVGDILRIGIIGVATIGAIGYATYDTIVKEKSQSTSVPNERVDIIPKAPKRQTQYWTANKNAVPGNSLTYTQALARVKAGGNIIALNRNCALAIAKWFPNSFYELPHGGGKPGYYPHYHIGKHGDPHIWFYPDF